ncbi:MAG TPA: hypothetical protein VEI80_01790 [Candidatus Acidoferrales bacterium]|nr:hypothetical protein [Candidatus Acidoferrales bacterium]
MSRNRQNVNVRDEGQPFGRLNRLLLGGAVVSFAFLAYRVLFGGMDMTLNLAGSAGPTFFMFYALAVYGVTAPSLLLALEESSTKTSAWDHAFFSGMICFYLYILTVAGFAAVVVAGVLGMLPTLNLSAITRDPLLLTMFWLALFATPAIFMKGPLAEAAQAERHGMQSSTGLGHIGYAMTFAAAVYVFLKLLPSTGNLLILLAEIIAATLIVACILTIMRFGREYHDLLNWLAVTVFVSVIVLAVSTFFKL